MPELGLDAQQGIIGLDEGRDLWSMGEEALHLATVESDREAAEAVDRDRALLRDFHRQGLGRLGCD